MLNRVLPTADTTLPTYYSIVKPKLEHGPQLWDAVLKKLISISE